jgi:hypothetical protein
MMGTWRNVGRIAVTVWQRMGVLRVELGLLASAALANCVNPVRITVAGLANRAGCRAAIVLVRGDLGGSTELLDSVDRTGFC